jgi:hypothetical protein
VQACAWGVPAAPLKESIVKSSPAIVAVSATLFVGALLFVAGVAHAEYRCEPPKSHFDRIACAKAREGPAALRQFIERIRPLESLYYYDYVSPQPVRAARDVRDVPADAPVGAKLAQSLR